MKKVNRSCTFPGEVIMTSDNGPYMLVDGTPIEILEWEKGCKTPKGRGGKNSSTRFWYCRLVGCRSGD